MVRLYSSYTILHDGGTRTKAESGTRTVKEPKATGSTKKPGNAHGCMLLHCAKWTLDQYAASNKSCQEAIAEQWIDGEQALSHVQQAWKGKL